MKSYKYILYGLDCANCAKKIEDKIAKTEGYEDVNVNFSTLKLSFKTDKKDGVKEEIVKIVTSLEPEVEVLDEGKEKEDTQRNGFDIIRLILGLAIFLIGMYGNFGDLVCNICTVVSLIILLSRTAVKGFKQVTKNKVLDENTLIVVSSIGAYLVGKGMEGVMVITLYEIGKILEARAVSKTRKSISSLMDIKPEYANIKINDDVKKVLPDEVKIGDIIVVKAGEKIPLDGKVISGTAELDNSALTGESKLVKVKKDDKVLSGSINAQGLIEIEVEEVYENSTVNQILNMVENATDKKAKTENFVAKAAKIYTPVVVFLAVALTVLPTIVVGDFQQWLSRALVFLVASCPCALVLSVPLTFFSGIGAISKKGALVKGSTYLQTLSGLNTLVVDKTGTITKGEFTVVETDGEDDVMKVAASLERFSNHPIAQAIVKSYKGDYIDFDTTEEIAGYGLMGVKDGEKYFVGSQRLMERENVALSDTKYNIYVSKNNEYYGAIKAEDTIKPDSSKAIADLKALGVKDVVMLTGDKQDIAEEIGEKAGVTKVYAGLLPQGKVEKVEEIYSKNNNAVVGAVGDGINDAPVLARADVGIAMGGIGSDAAIEAADIVIMNDELSKLPVAIKYARMTMKTVKENVWFALGVKAVVLILAALGYANMWLAVFADVGVALLAILNATKVMRK